MNRKEATARNIALVERRLRDPTIMWRDLAAEFGVSTKTARRIWLEYRDDIKRVFVEDTTDYLAVVAEKMKEFEQIRGDLWRAARQAAVYNNQAAWVGALKALIDLHFREIGLLQKAGLLPNDLGAVRVQLDMRVVTDGFIEVFHKYLSAKDAKRAEQELLDVLRPRLSRASAFAATTSAEPPAELTQ